jgi:hypothetical protein
MGNYDFLPNDQPGPENAGLIRVSTGAQFRVRPLPRALVRRVLQSVPDVPVPVVTLADGTTEENPLDPAFERAQQEADAERYRRLARLMKTRGLELVDVGPLPCPEDDRWVDDLRVIGIEADVSTPDARYGEWIDLVALANDADATMAFTAAQQAVGLLEWEVMAALRFFPDLA